MGFENLKREFSFLSEYTDKFIKATGVDVLIKAETSSRKLQKLDKERKAEDKLFQNREALSSSVSSVPSGPDNRLDVFHPARFLPGATCSAAKLWLQARSVIISELLTSLVRRETSPPPQPVLRLRAGRERVQVEGDGALLGHQGPQEHLVRLYKSEVHHNQEQEQFQQGGQQLQ